MSAFFIAINRNRRAFDKKIAQRMMSSIDRFGHDAKTLIVQDHYAIAYQSRWCVPEEVNEHQPRLDKKTGRWFLFHGRVDNRDELFNTLGIVRSVSVSDASLMQQLFILYGHDFLNDVVGPFVFVVFEPSSNMVTMTRDGMGGRYLCHRISDEHILIATYELAIVEHGSIAYNLNDQKVARSLVNEMEPRPSSTISGITPLNPGELIIVDHSGPRSSRFYQPDPTRRIRFDSDQQYADEFKRLLRQAVTRRLRSTGRVGSMLSGGLDSVPITILAAQQLAQPLQAYSWVFDKYPEQDERRYSSPVCQQYGIEQHRINCDQIWPKFGADTHLNPVVPFGIPYSEFQQETFRRAQEHNVSTLLTGIHGDLLYESTHGILYELLKDRRWRDAWSEGRRLWSAVANKWAWFKFYGLRALPVVEKVSAFRRRRRSYPASCLQDNIASLIKTDEHWLHRESQKALRPEQWRIVFDGFAGEDAAYGRYMEAKYAIDRRYPFRDRELCEFMLAIPSDQLAYNMTKRPIVKRAFNCEFTPELLARNDKTNFSPVINAGIEQDALCKQWFQAAPRHWSYYVKECYFEPKDGQRRTPDVIQWRCGYYNYWKSVCATL